MNSVQRTMTVILVAGIALAGVGAVVGTQAATADPAPQLSSWGDHMDGELSERMGTQMADDGGHAHGEHHTTEHNHQQQHDHTTEHNHQQQHDSEQAGHQTGSVDGHHGGSHC